jgi:methionyl-tRNA formyltransferase
MKILFVGTVRFSRRCLGEILDQGGEVVGVLTLPAEKARFNSDYADLGNFCAKWAVPCHRIGNINDPETVHLIRSLAPDVIFVFGWSQLIRKEVLDLPPLGCIGSHPALLPRNRGRHPLIWALVEGLEESGLTFFYLGEGADDGDIFWQRPFPITLEDDASTLYAKMEELGVQAIREFLPQLQAGNAPRIPQDHRLATTWRKRGEKDGEITWSAPSLTTYNLVRALTRPYVGAHTWYGEHRLLVWRASLLKARLTPEQEALAAGTVLACGDGWLDVRTGDGSIRISDFQAPLAIDWQPGARFGEKP